MSDIHVTENCEKKIAIEKALRKLGVHIPEIKLPNGTVDLKKWAVVACDQYTSQCSYWKSVEADVADAPSTLHMIFPEVYLEGDDKQQRILNICNTMQQYMKENVLTTLSPSFVYVERKLDTGLRKGLLVGLDLEQYDYSEGSQTLIRTTEGTVLDRLPPRIAIRKDAVLETPHIMVLIDDPEETVIERAGESLSEADKIYDFDLMKDGGHITGYQVNDLKTIEDITESLVQLADPDEFRKKYNVDSAKGVLLFAMGDGNHSFATAKACWDAIKAKLNEEERQNHPARFTLVELVNVHDESLVFEPIHRVLFQVNPNHVLQSMADYYSALEQGFEFESFHSKEEMMDVYDTYLKIEKGIHVIPYVSQGQWGLLKISQPNNNLEAGTLQGFLDAYLKNNNEVDIDYIHGEEVTAELGSQPGNMGFLLPIMNKNDLFKTVIVDGALPRKTFSMGEAHEKRYYLECRKIVK